MTRKRRKGNFNAPEIIVKKSNETSVKREIFFSNKQNKGAFVKFLGNRLTQAGYHVLHAEEDADTLIAKTTIDAAKLRIVTLMSDDTDILCILLYHFQPNNPFKLVLKYH